MLLGDQLGQVLISLEECRGQFICERKRGHLRSGRCLLKETAYNIST